MNPATPSGEAQQPVRVRIPSRYRRALMLGERRCLID